MNSWPFALIRGRAPGGLIRVIRVIPGMDSDAHLRYVIMGFVVLSFVFPHPFSVVRPCPTKPRSKRFTSPSLADGEKWLVSREQDDDYITMEEDRNTTLRTARKNARDFRGLFDEVRVFVKENGEFTLDKTY